MMDLVMDNKTALLLVLFFIAVVHVWAAPETDQCSEGTYRNSDGECVSQCPCGYYGDTNSRICEEGTEDMFFNQTQINFKLTVRETLDTPILSAVLYIDKNIANKTEFELAVSGPVFLSQSIYYRADDDYFNTPRLRLQANKSNGSRIFECSAGTRTFVMVPFKVYALSVVGSFEIVVYSKRPHLPELGRYSWYPPSVNAKGLVDSGCSGDLKYASTSRECVKSCPCGTYQLLGSCETSSAVSFDSLLKEVYVLPTTKPGSIVANLSLLIDETVLNSSYYMTISKDIGSISHNDSGKITTNLLSNNFRPLFELTSSAPDLVVSDDNTGRLISHLRMASPVQECVSNSTRYVAVSFGLRLLSDSLYHLGDHLITIRAELKNGTNTINYSRQSLRLIVEAECPDSTQLYDFALHRCVSSCSCGYTPFRSHTTAYCEAVEYRPSNFHDETQTVLVHNSIERVSSSVLLYVNLNSQLLQDTLLQPIIGRLSINSTLNQSAEVFFTQPDGTLNFTVDIVLNSSLDFSYCYDQLRNMNHTLYSVPIVVIPHNESDPAGPANHTHTIQLTFHAFREYHSFFSTYTPETLNLFVNKTGTLPVAVTVPVGVIVGVAIITIVVIAVVIAAVLVGIIIYKKRKGKHYNDEEVSCKHLSTEDTVDITNASEKIENRKTMDAEELDNMRK